MVEGGKVIDFNEAVKRLAKSNRVVSKSKAIVLAERARNINIEQIEETLSRHPELAILHKKGITSAHIALWLEMFPAMSLQELMAIIQYAVQRIRDGEDEQILEYLFQPLLPEG